MLLQALIWSLLLLAATSATQYECLSHPEMNTTCMIISMNYQPDGDPIAFPTGYDHYWVRSHSKKKIYSHVTVLDEALYEAMHRPAGIEMIDVNMENLTLPPELLLGNFAKNILRSVTVKAGQIYEISHLILESNNLKELAFVSSLVNLEILYLGCNQIATIPGSAFAPLAKLQFLFLQYNDFTSIPWTDLPRSLIQLNFDHGQVESVDFTNVSLPSLKYLSLRHNALATINETALLLAAPRLEEVLLYNSEMTEDETDRIDAKLSSSYINSFNGEWSEHKGGWCTRRQPNPVVTPDGTVDTGMAILLSAVVIALASAFVYIVVLAFKLINR